MQETVDIMRRQGLEPKWAKRGWVFLCKEGWQVPQGAGPRVLSAGVIGAR